MARVDFSSIRMIFFDTEIRVQCNAEPRGQLGFAGRCEVP
jgi:hypothetical protein